MGLSRVLGGVAMCEVIMCERDICTSDPLNATVYSVNAFSPVLSTGGRVAGLCWENQNLKDLKKQPILMLAALATYGDRWTTLEGYLAHKKPPPFQGPP